jgi:hypothetical protein
MAYFPAGGNVAASQRFGSQQSCIFAVDQQGRLNVSWVVPTTPWQGPVTISAADLTIPGANVAACAQGPFGTSTTDVFLFDNNGRLNVFSAQPTLGWNGPTPIGQAGVANPGDCLACAPMSDTQTGVFFIDRQGRINGAWVDDQSGAWIGPQPLDPNAVAPPGAPVAAIYQTGTQEPQTTVFFVGTNGQLNTLVANGFGPLGGTHQWGDSGLVPAGAAVTACQWGQSQTDVFLFDNNGILNLFSQTGTGSWSGPQVIGQGGFANAGAPLLAVPLVEGTQANLVTVDQFGVLQFFWAVGGQSWQGPKKMPAAKQYQFHPASIAACPLASAQTDLVLIDEAGQLNIFTNVGVDTWSGPVVRADPVAVPSGGYSGSNNYVLASGSNCATLTNVQVTIYITEDLVYDKSTNANPQRTPTNGFSIQVNAETDQTAPLDWLQFMFHGLTGFFPWINLWTPTTIVTTSDTWGSSVPANDPMVTMPKAKTIPAGYSIITTLYNDDNGRVTAGQWNVLDANGHSVVLGHGPFTKGQPFTQGLSTDPPSGAAAGGVPSTDLSPIASFQVTFGGDSNRDQASFSSGAGLIIMQADQTMTARPETSYPPCIGYTNGTGETSNVAYGQLCATPSTMFSQAFSVQSETAQVRIAKPGARESPIARHE